MGIITPWAMDAIPVDPEDPDGDLTPAYDSANLRRIFSTFLSAGDTPTRARPGVASGGDVSVVDDVAYIGPCLVVVTTADGSFITGLDSEAEIPLQARHATNDRRDRVVVRVNHTSAERSAAVEVLAGTPAPTPQPPSTPAGAESLGVIDVPNASGGGATFAPGQRYTAARGGVIKVPNLAARDRLTDLTDGMQVFAGSGSSAVLWIRSGGEWHREWAANSGQPFRMASGGIGVTGDGSSTASASVSFPSGRFTTTPNIVTSAGGNSLYNAVAGSSSSSGFTMLVRNVNDGNFDHTVQTRWWAVQMTPTNASG